MVLKGRADSVVLRGRVVLDQGELKAVQGHGRFLPLSPYPVHVYDKIKSRQKESIFKPVERKEFAEEIKSEDIPPPAPPIPFQPEKAASLHISNIDLKLHPNDEEEAEEPVSFSRTSHRTSIRVAPVPSKVFL